MLQYTRNINIKAVCIAPRARALKGHLPQRRSVQNDTPHKTPLNIKRCEMKLGREKEGKNQRDT